MPKVTFMPSGKVIEFDAGKVPFQGDGLPGSILDIALGHGVPMEHACGGHCACTTCHVIVREGMENLNELTRKMNLLKEKVRSRMIDLDFNSFRMGYLEAVFARGDRRLSAVLLEAWRNGAKFDAWKDFFDFEKWLSFFSASGVDPDFYVLRKRGEDEILPWDFIDIRI